MATRCGCRRAWHLDVAVEGSWDPDVPVGGVAPEGVVVEGCGTCVEAGCVVKGRVGDIYVFFPFCYAVGSEEDDKSFEGMAPTPKRRKLVNAKALKISLGSGLYPAFKRAGGGASAYGSL